MTIKIYITDGDSSFIECACGCNSRLNNKDRYGRLRRHISGHNNRKYDPNDKHAIQKAWIKRNRGWVNSRRRRISRERKVELIKRLGSRCKSCDLEYNGKNGAAFEFHHVDPSMKMFTIGKELNNKSFLDLKNEVKKCQLLCGNCHSIYHIGEY